MPAQIVTLETAADFVDTADSVTPTVTPQGAAGLVSYSYKLVAKNAAGKHAAAGTAGTTATGNAVLDGTNFNRLTWTPASGPTEVEVASWDVYRTVGGATQGLIGNVPVGVHQFDDVGLVGDASTAPATNNSGTGKEASVLHLDHKSLQFSGDGSTFTGQVQVQGSVDGKEWENVGAAASASGFADVTRSYGLLRANLITLTAGVIKVYCAGTGYGGG